MLTEAASFLNRVPGLFKASSIRIRGKICGCQGLSRVRRNGATDFPWVSEDALQVSSLRITANISQIWSTVVGYEELAGEYLNQSETQKYFELIRGFLVKFGR